MSGGVKKCASCNKTVYPVEELKCLDSFWHKACFKCQVCGMTLNMKNYKGYDKRPYCNAHYPTTKFTAVADTPENMRLSNQTKNQSTVAYHAEFNKDKGRYTTVSDDPEIMRLKKTSDQASNVAYHNIRAQREVMERNRPEYEDEAVSAGRPEQRVQRPIGKIDSYDPNADFSSPYSNRVQMTTIYDSERGGKVQGGGRQVGRIEDYEGPHDQGMRHQPPRQQAYHSQQAQQAQHGYPQQGYHPAPQQGYNPAPSQAAVRQPVPQQQQQYNPHQKGSGMNRGNVYRAIYDYTAGDTDEVSFNDGDLIIQCQPIDAGWMEGRVERTGQYGMLPSNYVERV